jgi:hypothetical protein
MHSARCARVNTRSRLTRGVADMPHTWMLLATITKNYQQYQALSAPSTTRPPVCAAHPPP